MSSYTLASVTFKIVTNVLSQTTQGHRAFRIKNLQADEALQFIQIWSQHESNVELSDVSLIVADSLDGTIPARFVAEAGNSITWYRNHIKSALVYIEIKDQSDAQGLQNFFTLRDSNYLDGSFDDTCTPYNSVAQLVISEAWATIAHDDTPPTLLVERLPEVIRLLHATGQSIPIRKYIKFAEGACRAWLDDKTPKDALTANNIVGQALWMLELFPDVLWRKDETEGKIQRRLELNSRYADLRSSTGDIDPEALEKVLNQKIFCDQDANPLTPEESQHWRGLCVHFLREPSTFTRQKIPFFIFEQLFVKDASGLKLGDRIRTEISNEDGTRIAEFIKLDVIDGLNQRSPVDALKLLEAAPTDISKPALVSLLTRKSRKALEKLINPPVRVFTNPMLEISRQLETIREQSESTLPIKKIRLELAESSFASPSLGLFAFIYGNTLQEVASHSIEAQLDCILEVDKRLITSAKPPCFVQTDEGIEDEESETDNETQSTLDIDWNSFPLKLTAFDGQDAVVDTIDNLQWKPESMEHLAMFWLLVADPESPIFQGLGNLKASEEMLLNRTDWIKPFVQRHLSLQVIPPAELGIYESLDYIDALLQARTLFKDTAITSGLSTESINSYFDAWRVQIQLIRHELVNQGNRIDVVESVLCSDSIDFGGNFRIVLPNHPLRLRWLGAYLSESQKVLKSVLDDGVKFAIRDGESYLNWLEERSPNELPPLIISSDTATLLPRSENSWFGEYAPIQSTSVSLEDDSLANDEICGRIVSYVNAHPYKVDGLSILLLLPYTDTLAAEIIGKLSTTSHKSGGKVTVTIAAPTGRWESIAREVERLQIGERTRRKKELFPPFDLTFLELDNSRSIEEILDGRKFDIGIITHLLNGSLQLQQVTDTPSSVRGSFDPLLDATSKLITSETSGETSIILKPERPDSALESWSTLVVRAVRRSPVSPSQPENTDYIQLRQDFDSSAIQFNSLHKACHWVITLERHISRKQIESREAGSPDVLSITEGVGRNELNTLIVSSRAGRELVESRLARKLRKLVTTGHSSSDSSDQIRTLASSVYDETRRLSPHLALSAMGISRVTEEILGVALARRIAEKYFLLPEGIGISAWISLDEYADWFGGQTATRADMCRLTFRLKDDGSVLVDVLSVEGKLRQTFDPHGITQVKTTWQHFHDILNTTEADDSRSKVDAKYWRNKIISAIESCADEALEGFGETSREESHAIWLQIREAFREGFFELASENAMYSATLWEKGDINLEFTNTDGVNVVRSSNAHILPLLENRMVLPTFNQSIANASRSRAVTETVTPKTNICTTVVSQQPRDAIDDPLPNKTNSLESTFSQKRMSTDELRKMYDEILACYSSFGVNVTGAPAEDEPIIEGPASILFKVRPGAGVDPRKVYEKAEALKLKLRLESDQNVGFDNDRGYVTIDVPKSENQRYFVDAEELWARWTRPEFSLATPLGEDRFGETVEIDFSSSNSPHLLIGGTTGSGKSEALNTILYGLATHYSSSELQFLLVDPKGTELSNFENSRHLRGTIGIFDDDAIDLLKEAVIEMKSRYERFRAVRVRSIAEYNKQSTTNERLPWWVIVLDEYGDLTSDSQKKKEIEQELKRLAQMARACGIHVIIATQKPSAEVISTNLRSNLPAQLALRVKSGIESRVIMDDMGAETLNGKGDAFVKAEGKLRRVQCASVRNPEPLRP